MAFDPTLAPFITGGVALVAAMLSLVLGVKNYLLAHRKLTLEEETKQAEARRLTDKVGRALAAAGAGGAGGGRAAPRVSCKSSPSPRAAADGVAPSRRGTSRPARLTPSNPTSRHQTPPDPAPRRAVPQPAGPVGPGAGQPPVQHNQHG
jgi:hypothetical protein